MHSIAALLQFEHGCLLSHLTFRFLQVTHDLELRLLAGGEVDCLWGLDDCSLGDVLESCLVKPLVCGSNGDVVSLGDAAKSDMAAMVFYV